MKIIYREIRAYNDPIGARKGSRKRQKPAAGEDKRPRVEEVEYDKRKIKVIEL